MARVIRGTGKIIPAAVVDASTRAREIVAAAKVEAKQLLAAAESEANRLETDTKIAAEAEGKAKAAATLQMAAQQQASMLKGAQDTVVSLAIVAAKRVAGDIAKERPERIREVVTELLKRAERASRITVRVHPNDRATIEAVAAEGIEMNVEADDKLQQGECIVETDLGDLDARFDVQLDALERALLTESR